MTNKFHVTVAGLKKIYDMPGTWCDDDYRSLMAQLEVEDIDEMAAEELLDYLFMALQDIEIEEAADLVLAYKLQKSVTAGVRQNIVQDFLLGQRPWEEASDISLHARLFAVAVLLNKAFPKTFGRPDMMLLSLQLEAQNAESKELLLEPPEAAFVTRLLADGMDENSILERLFDEQLAAYDFPEAEGIIWQADFSEQAADGSSALLTVYSSAHWLDSMEQVEAYDSRAYNDREEDEDDDD